VARIEYSLARWDVCGQVLTPIARFCWCALLAGPGGQAA
jgi:hypothetical protein